MKSFWVSLRMLAWLTLLTGVIYPLIITVFAQVFFREKAEGSLMTHQGKVIGSRLIGQKFESEKYFWPRPSANDYNGLSSGGSNLGPTSKALKEAIETRKTAILKGNQKGEIPSELLFASASGLDPHISPKTAQFQVDRIAAARHLKAEVLMDLIEKHTQNRLLRFIGRHYVNVLELNLALDSLEEKPK
jgi:potassium-transporting ATPase KdpC subunit